VPRISAPTVVEHRARQRRAVLDAAAQVALEQGGRGVTFAAVSARSGLARSSLYEYFPSPDALLAELVVDSLDRVTAEVRSAVDAQRDPRLRLRAYVRAVLRLADSGDRALGRALSDLELPPECSAALGAMHERLASPLVDALAALGSADPARDAAYAQGVLEAAARRIESGGGPRSEAAAAEAFIVAALEPRGD
jgi:AcrR family transcriptional regulator